MILIQLTFNLAFFIANADHHVASLFARTVEKELRTFIQMPVEEFSSGHDRPEGVAHHPPIMLLG